METTILLSSQHWNLTIHCFNNNNSSNKSINNKLCPSVVEINKNILHSIALISETQNTRLTLYVLC